MSVSAIENSTVLISPEKKSSPDAMRRAAEQFEAVLLMQLTSVMNSTGEINNGDGEDSLFGGDGGSDLAKKMFSEQMATTIAQSGGVGLADMIMEKFGASQAKTSSASKAKNFSNAIAAVKAIKENAAAETTSSVNTAINFADETSEIAGNNSDSSILSDKILSSTRPRIVPGAVITENKTVSVGGTFPMMDSNEKVKFQMPVIGRITSGFGIRFHPVDRKTKFHTGIDIAVPKGTGIGAAADGVVKFAGWKGGYGYAVIVQHADGTETLYGHNEKLLVKEGQPVSAGETISLSGSTGKSTGPHLHFEVRQNGRVVNPNNFLSNVLPRNADR